MKTPSTTTYFYAAARLAIVTTLVGLGGCASQSPSLATAPLRAEQIAQIVAAPDRTPADRTNDLRRKPEPMLALIGALPGMVAAFILAVILCWNEYFFAALLTSTRAKTLPVMWPVKPARKVYHGGPWRRFRQRRFYPSS